MSAEYDLVCIDCKSKFNSENYGELCPNCYSINIESIDNIKKEQTELKNFIIYYVKFGQFKVMHKDSHFYVHSQNLNDLRDPNSGVRYYTESSAIKAINKMKESSPDWDLKIKKL